MNLHIWERDYPRDSKHDASIRALPVRLAELDYARQIGAAHESARMAT